MLSGCDRAERLYRVTLIAVQRLTSCHGGGRLGVREGSSLNLEEQDGIRLKAVRIG
ncbi:MAG TPA: hypothetical protein VFM04_01535 [Candidatus Methylomirabilis sp.]|nr:hypothetical protein [Candidatus Methylomirabilis sp.]